MKKCSIKKLEKHILKGLSRTYKYLKFNFQDMDKNQILYKITDNLNVILIENKHTKNNKIIINENSDINIRTANNKFISLSKSVKNIENSIEIEYVSIALFNTLINLFKDYEIPYILINGDTFKDYL